MGEKIIEVRNERGGGNHRSQGKKRERKKKNNNNNKEEEEEEEEEEEQQQPMSATTTTTLQELLQREYDTFIPDELDDKFYDDETYKWEIMFETVKLFVMKEGRWPRGAEGRG